MCENQQENILKEKTLRSLGEAARKSPNKHIGFIAVKGRRYKKDLMVVGRALNGSNHCFNFSQLTNPRERNHVLRMIRESAYGRPDEDTCPLQWVTDEWGNENDYNPAKSAFWRVIRRIVHTLKIAAQDEPWSSSLVWSNLYKISPHGGGNPGNKLCNLQLDGCKTLLFKEIEDYQPKRLLFLTGWDWAKDFLEGKGDIQSVDKGYVQASGSLDCGGQIHVVVAVHPQCKKEDRWVQEVMAEFIKGSRGSWSRGSDQYHSI